MSGKLVARPYPNVPLHAALHFLRVCAMDESTPLHGFVFESDDERKLVLITMKLPLPVTQLGEAYELIKRVAK